MTDDLRNRLHDEMAGTARPPMEGVVLGALARGSSIRRRQRVASGAGTTVLVGAVAAVVVFSGQFATGPSASVAGSAGSAPTVAKSVAKPVAKVVAKVQANAVVAPQAVNQAVTAPATTAPVTTAPLAAAPATADLQAQLTAQLTKLNADALAGKSVTQDKNRYQALESQAETGPVKAATALPAGVPATSTGMLQLLTTLLPGASHPGIADDGSRAAEAYVSTPTGPAMVRVFLDHASDVPAGCADLTGCTVAPNGDIVEVGGLSANCIQTQFVRVFRPDGSEIMVDLSTCLDWNGTENPASPLAMTLDQATAIAEDRRWDASMDPALVTAGAAAFPTPYQFG